MRIAAHIFVTDIDRRIDIPGETQVERAANAVRVIGEARDARLVDVAAELCNRCYVNFPKFVNEQAVWHVQGVIRGMVTEGLLCRKREREMLESVRLDVDGQVLVSMVGMFGEVIA